MAIVGISAVQYVCASCERAPKCRKCEKRMVRALTEIAQVEFWECECGARARNGSCECVGRTYFKLNTANNWSFKLDRTGDDYWYL